MSTKTNDETVADVRKHVRERYGKIAADFQSGAAASCCAPDTQDSNCCGSSDEVSIDLISQIYETPDAADLPEDVTGLSLGCGDPITLAALQPGQTVLDLGSGGGIDCFLAAKRVGESGRVIGIDMTSEMIERARSNKTRLGAENVEFRLGEIEHLPVADETADVIISNCVINLSPDKPQVFREAFRAMRSGGKLAVSDIVTDGPLPDVIKNSLSAWAGCIAGALDVQEYISAIEAAGFVDVEVTPDYWDSAAVEQAAEQLGLENTDGCCVAISDGGQANLIKLDESAEFSAESLSKAVFSAKVTARKP
ncbi:arsenite methyltransferase [Chloroflexota bacterium]